MLRASHSKKSGQMGGFQSVARRELLTGDGRGAPIASNKEQETHHVSYSNNFQLSEV